MWTLPFNSLRSRLLALLLFFFFFVLGGILIQAFLHFQKRTDQVQEMALSLARLVASRQEAKISEGRYLLAALAKFGPTAGGSPEACTQAASEFIGELPWLAAVGFADPQGRVFCEAGRLKLPPNVGGRACFRTALEKAEFMVGMYFLAEDDRLSVLPLLYPLRDASGRVERVVFGLLDMGWMGQFAAGGLFPPGTTLLVMDLDGFLLSYYPESARWMEISAGETDLGRTIMARQAGGREEGLLEELTGLDKIPRLYAYVALRKEEGPGAFLAIGIPADEAYGPPRRALFLQLAYLMPGAGLLLLLVWWGSDRLLIGPLRGLTASLRRLAGGDLSARTDPVSGAREVGEVFAEFNRMAESLENESARRQWADGRLRVSERRYRSLFLNTRNGIVLIGDDGRIVEANPQACLSLGYSPEEITGIERSRILDPSNPGPAQALEEWERSGRASAELDLVRKDGSRFPAGISFTTFEGETGKPQMTLIFRDISRRRQAEEALRRSEQKFRRLFEMESDALFFSDLQTLEILEANESAARLYGYSREELVGKSAVAISAEPEKTERALAARETRVPFRFHRHQDGTVFPIEAALSFFTWEGRPVFLSAIRDIRERVKAEEEREGLHLQIRRMARRLMEVQESERREISRELHDQVGQSLTAIALNLAIIRNLLPSPAGEKIEPRLRDSERVLQSMAARVRDLMSDLRPPLLEGYGLGAALRGYGEEFAGRTGVRVSVREEGAAARLSASAELALFRIAQEALTNVSRHARAAGVSITLEEKDSLFRLTVADDGKGFDPSRAAGEREAAGMGLTAMRERAEAIGARLTVASRAGAGTRVMVELRQAPAKE